MLVIIAVINNSRGNFFCLFWIRDIVLYMMMGLPAKSVRPIPLTNAQVNGTECYGNEVFFIYLFIYLFVYLFIYI